MSISKRNDFALIELENDNKVEFNADVLRAPGAFQKTKRDRLARIDSSRREEKRRILDGLSVEIHF